MKKTIFVMVLFALVTQTMLLAQQVTNVGLVDLLSEWDDNKIRVKQNYHNKTIRTEGEVVNIYTDNSIELSIDEATLFVAVMLWKPIKTQSLRVNFTSSERSKLANLNKGQTITIRGVYNGDRNVINNAVIETTPAATAQPTPAPAPAPNNTAQASTANQSGISFFNQKNYDSAIAQFTEAIRLDPNNAVYYKNRGTVYNEKGDYDRAIADATEAIRLRPNDYAEPYLDRGVAYANKGNLTQARTDINKALQINPNYQAAKNVSAQLQQMEQQQQQARATPTPAPTPAPTPTPTPTPSPAPTAQTGQITLQVRWVPASGLTNGLAKNKQMVVIVDTNPSVSLRWGESTEITLPRGSHNLFVIFNGGQEAATATFSADSGRVVYNATPRLKGIFMDEVIDLVRQP
jgi:tetratricopeptide (TPR) repeat protein